MIPRRAPSYNAAFFISPTSVKVTVAYNSPPLYPLMVVPSIVNELVSSIFDSFMILALWVEALNMV